MGTSVKMVDATYGHFVADAETYERDLLDAYDVREEKEAIAMEASEREIVCARCRRVDEIGPTWEASGETDELGRMVGTCPGCLTGKEVDALAGRVPGENEPFGHLSDTEGRP